MIIPRPAAGSSRIPSLIGPAIEESLRFNTSAQRFKRIVMREAELHGQTLRVGDKVALAFGSGNRDGANSRDPDIYDIDRRPHGHLGFGAGKHFCLGSQMARLVTEAAMQRFLARVPDYHLTSASSRGIRRPIFAARSHCRSGRVILTGYSASRIRYWPALAPVTVCALQHAMCNAHTEHRNSCKGDPK